MQLQLVGGGEEMSTGISDSECNFRGGRKRKEIC